MSTFHHRRKVADIPRLPIHLLQLAHICAEELWLGYDYQAKETIKKAAKKGQPSTRTYKLRNIPSDEYFLIRFSGHHFFPHKLNGRRLLSACPAQIDEPLLRELNYIASVGAERRVPGADFTAACDWLMENRSIRLANWMNTLRFGSSLNLGLNLVSDLSLAFSTGIAPRVAYALFSNRICFFAFPEIEIYNYSGEIAKSLRLFVEPESQMTPYQEILNDGFSSNWDQLCMFQMPASTQGEDLFRETIMRGNWWQRRVFDLALKIRASKTPILFSERVMSKFCYGPTRHY